MNLISKKIKCQDQIVENNKIIAKLSKENERLFRSYMNMCNQISEKRKARYDKELATDNWKKTDYWISKNH